MKHFVVILIIAVALSACKRDNASNADTPEIEFNLPGGVAMGCSKEEVLTALFAQGFTDAASGEQDMHFDTIPTVEGASPIELKILVPTDSTGFEHNGSKWTRLQLQFDAEGLFCVTMQSPYQPRATVNKQYQQLLRNLLDAYPMQETVVGTSGVVGESTDIMGHRYRHNKRQLQIYQNNEDGGVSNLTLSYTALS